MVFKMAAVVTLVVLLWLLLVVLVTNSFVSLVVGVRTQISKESHRLLTPEQCHSDTINTADTPQQTLPLRLGRKKVTMQFTTTTNT